MRLTRDQPLHSRSSPRYSRPLAKKRRRKRPAVAQTPNPSKRPTFEADPTARPDDRIAWRFARLDLHGKWGWSALGEDANAVLAKLRNFESLTLGELMRLEGSTQIGTEDLPAPAQKRLVDTGHDDLDAVWELRLTGKQRIWGAIDRAVFYLLWWDPEHTVYPSKKKHT